MSIHRKISRRTWLKGMAVSAAAGVPLMLAPTTAEAKASKAAVHYRGSPNGTRMCRICKFYIAGAGACQLVEGRISPAGWCNLYTPA